MQQLNALKKMELRRRNKEYFIPANFDPILPHLFLTGIEGIDSENMQTHKIKCIVNCAIELEDKKFADVENVRLDLHDKPDENIYRHFDRICDKIEEVRVHGGNTVVHCAVGRSRSAAVILAYLMKYSKMNLKDAYTFIRTERNIRPNEGFFKQLIEYEKTLFGKNSVELVKTKNDKGEDIEIPDVYLIEDSVKQNQ